MAYSTTPFLLILFPSGPWQQTSFSLAFSFRRCGHLSSGLLTVPDTLIQSFITGLLRILLLQPLFYQSADNFHKFRGEFSLFVLFLNCPCFFLLFLSGIGLLEALIFVEKGYQLSDLLQRIPPFLQFLYTQKYLNIPSGVVSVSHLIPLDRQCQLFLPVPQYMRLDLQKLHCLRN